MKHLPLRTEVLISRPVDPIAQDREAQVSQADPDLVQEARLRSHLDQGGAIQILQAMPSK